MCDNPFMAERTPRYQVVVYTKRLPESFRGPDFWKELLSNLSEAPNSTIGDRWHGMPLEEAEEIAKDRTEESYVDGYGKLRSARGVVIRVS